MLFLLGAGASADSGYPTYRGPDGRYGAGVGALVAGSWDILAPIALKDGDPGPTYRKIAALCTEREEPAMIVTQNIDGLALKLDLGETEVIELHGNGQRFRCSQCANVEPATVELRACSQCGQPMRPDIVQYGEDVDSEHLKRVSQFIKQHRIHTVYVIGTTLQFAYLHDLIRLASARGAVIVHVNLDPEYREHSHRVKTKLTAMGLKSKSVRRKRPHQLLTPEQFISEG